MIKKMYGFAGLIMLFALLSRLFGFIRELLISYYFGTTVLADMFYIISSIPLVLYTGFALAYSNAFIPSYHKAKAKNNYLLSSTLLIFLISLIVSISMMLFPVPILKLIAPGVALTVLEQYKMSVIIVAFQVFFIGFNGLFNGLLNAEEKYFVPSLFNMLFTLFVGLVIYVLNDKSINVIFIGITIVYILQFFVQLFFMKSFILKWRKKSRVSLEIMKKQMYETLLIFSSSSLSQINYFIDRALASTVYAGALSTVNYVHKLNGFLIGIAGLLISNLLFPIISKSLNGNDENSQLKNIDRFTYVIMILIIPTILLLSIFSSELVKILFQNGEFNSNDVANVSKAFSIIILGTGFYVLKDLYSYILYATSKSKLVFIVSFCSVLVNITLNFLLINRYGVNGLMASTLFSYIVSAVISLVIIKRSKIEVISVKKHVVLLFFLLISLLVGLLFR
ncbi:polysaccharide biosynthesis C-terminal domain-containing protein [Bacillus sp. FJAT-26377]|nr:polysaccharide biosynthesis C-terminal domain-containing protein [Bacillus sp. FJAT-26377]